MPIPKPNTGEKEDEFISRCMGNDIMIEEYPEEEQRAAVCYNEWRKKKAKLETMAMKDVEIAEIGKYKDFELTEEVFQQFINNLNLQVMKPVITIDHDLEQTKEMQKIMKSVNLGIIERLKISGRKLLADFKKVPKKLAELIESGRLIERSIEFFKKFRHANGNVYDYVLEGVTFHGGANGPSAISTLSDVIALHEEFKDNDYGDNELVSLMLKEVEDMSKVEIDKTEYDSLTKLKNDYASLENDNQRLKADFEEKEKEVEEVKQDAQEKVEEAEKVKAEAEKKIEEAEKQEEENLKNEATQFVDKIIQDKKLLPKYKDMKVSDYMRLKKGDEKEFSLFKEELETRDKVINFSDSVKDQDVVEKYKAKDYIPGDTKESHENIQKLIELKMAKDGISWNEAAYKLGVINEEEYKDQKRIDARQEVK